MEGGSLDLDCTDFPRGKMEKLNFGETCFPSCQYYHSGQVVGRKGKFFEAHQNPLYA